MIRFAGGWYADALPSGAFVALIQHSHLQTDRGRVELPLGQNVLYVRMAPDGVRFAGVGNQDDLCWEWNGRAWVSRGIAFGPRAVVYDASGDLRIIAGPPARGWRRIAPDGRVTFADESYADIPRRVWEYTDLGGLTIGQGGSGPHGEDPCIALIGGTRRLIEAGQCRFINVSEKDGRIAVAYVREDTRESVIRWMTRSEIASLPIVGTTQPNPGTPPSPTPEPTPMPEPANLKADVEAERAKYPAMLTHDQPAKILNAVAWKHRADGWGLSVKRGGNRVPSPQGVDVAYDILHHKPTNRLFDALTGDLAGVVTWGETSYHGDPVGRPWLAPIAPDGAPAPPPTPRPTPAPPDALAGILRRLEALEGPRTVAIRAHTGRYVVAEGEAVKADREHVGPWETFTLEPVQ